MLPPLKLTGEPDDSETCMSGSGKGSWKSACMTRNSLAAYSTTRARQFQHTCPLLWCWRGVGCLLPVTARARLHNRSVSNASADIKTKKVPVELGRILEIFRAISFKALS